MAKINIKYLLLQIFILISAICLFLYSIYRIYFWYNTSAIRSAVLFAFSLIILLISLVSFIIFLFKEKNDRNLKGFNIAFSVFYVITLLSFIILNHKISFSSVEFNNNELLTKLFESYKIENYINNITESDFISNDSLLFDNSIRNIHEIQCVKTFSSFNQAKNMSLRNESYFDNQIVNVNSKLFVKTPHFVKSMIHHNNPYDKYMQTNESDSVVINGKEISYAALCDNNGNVYQLTLVGEDEDSSLYLQVNIKSDAINESTQIDIDKSVKTVYDILSYVE